MEAEVSNVIELPVITKLPISPDKILEAAKGKHDWVLVLGVTPDGEFNAYCSGSEIAIATFYAQKFIQKVHNGDFE